MWRILPPAVGEALVRDHLTDMRRHPVAHRCERRSLRRTTGWLLVHIGLRLAVPRASVRAVAR